MLKKTPQSAMWASSSYQLKALISNGFPRDTLTSPIKDTSLHFQNSSFRYKEGPPSGKIVSAEQRAYKDTDLTAACLNKLQSSGQWPKNEHLPSDSSLRQSPRELELQINLQTSFNSHNLKYKYTSNTLMGQLIKYLKDIAGSQNVVFKSGNTMVDYVMTLEKQKVSIFNHIQPLSIRIQTLSTVDKLMQNSLKRFNIIRCIGSGGFSRVFLAQVHGVYVALKVIDKDFLLQNDKGIIVENEKKILTELNHPFVTKVYYTIETERKISIALEYCSGGELFYLLKMVKRMRESEARFYFLEVLSALKALHEKNMVYRDLKPENIIIDEEGHVRLADFGLSKIMEDEFTHSFCGSAEYMAPQMLQRGGHNASVDYYCIGALLYELVTGLPPYYSKDQNELFSNILNNDLEFPDKLGMSFQIKCLLSQLLVKDPSKRLGNFNGVQDIWSHPWLLGITESDVLAKRLLPPFKPNILEENFDNSDFKTEENEILSELQREKLHGDLRNPCLKSFYFESQQMKQKKLFIYKQNKLIKINSPFSDHNINIKNLSSRQKDRRAKQNIYKSIRPNTSDNHSPRKPLAIVNSKDLSYKKALPELNRYKSHGNLILKDSLIKNENLQNYSLRYSSQEKRHHHHTKYRENSLNKLRHQQNKNIISRHSPDFRMSTQNKPSGRPIGLMKQTNVYGISGSLDLQAQRRPNSHRNLDSKPVRYQSPRGKPSYPKVQQGKRELRKGYYNKEKLRNYFIKKY